jgi:hypothetical protein
MDNRLAVMPLVVVLALETVVGGSARGTAAAAKAARAVVEAVLPPRADGPAQMAHLALTWQPQADRMALAVMRFSVEVRAVRTDGDLVPVARPRAAATLHLWAIATAAPRRSPAEGRVRPVAALPPAAWQRREHRPWAAMEQTRGERPVVVAAQAVARPAALTAVQQTTVEGPVLEELVLEGPAAA